VRKEERYTRKGGTMSIKTTVREGRYWNVHGQSCCIVAIITNPVDWAAYINGVPSNLQREEEAIEWVSKHGAKLSEADAHHFFPTIDLPYRP